MTVVNHDARNQYTATNGQTVFSYTFEIAAASDIAVYQRASTDDPDDAADLLTYLTDYTLTGVGGENGGTVVLVSGAALNDIITIQSIVPAERDSSFTPGGVIQAENLNTEFDNLVLIYQRLLALLNDLTPRYATSAVVGSADLVLPILAANQTFVKNDADTAIIPFDLPSSGIAPAGFTYITESNETAGLPNSYQLAGTTNQIGLTVGVNQLAVKIVDNAILPGTAGIGVPQGTTAQRVTPSLGISLRYNTNLQSLEFWNGSTWTQLEDSTDITTLLALLASHAVGEGASLVGLQTSGTVQGFYDAQQIANATFLLKSGGTMTGSINFGGFEALNGTDPTLATSLATKNYVDQTALNGTSVYAISAGSLGTVTQSGAGVGATLTNAGVQATFALDGVNPPVGVNVLIKDTAAGMTAANEGIYTVTDVGSAGTNWILTRATSYNTTTEINNTGLIVAQNGATLAGTSWYNAATIVTVDTTNFSFNQFGSTFALKGANSDITSLSGLTGGISKPTFLTGANGFGLRTDTGAGNTALLQAYDVDGAVYTTFATLTANNTPTMDLSDAVTKAGAYIYRAGGTDVALSDGGTNASLVADNGAIVYCDAAGFNFLAHTTTAGLALLSGNASAPTWSTAPPITKVNIQTFAAGTSTYTPTAGTKFLTVEIVGGGASGGGGAGVAAQSAAGGGGGGAGYCRKTYTIAQLGANAAVVVGAGGAAGTAGNNPGNNGNDSTFTPAGAGVVLTAGKGFAGSGSASTATITSASGGLGGSATNGDLRIQGANGALGLVTSGSNSAAYAGAGGSSFLGNAGVNSTNVGAGVGGSGYGSGGSGAAAGGTNLSGGAGTDGICYVTEYISV